MSGFDFFLNQHAYWEREREEGPTDWGPDTELVPARELTDEDWAEVLTDFARERRRRESGELEP